MEAKIQKHTFYYINNCLNPNQKWKRDYPAKKRIDFIRYANVNWAVISNYIKDMDYEDFLSTPYWKAIAAHTKYKAGYRCQVCNSSAFLATHHRNYGIHGREHAHLNELIVLCKHCHQKFHGYERRITPSRSDTVSNKPRIILLGLIGLIIACLILESSVGWETFGKAIEKKIKISLPQFLK